MNKNPPSQFRRAADGLLREAI